MRKKTALITGILGQDGPALAKILLEKDHIVYGMMRRYSNPNFSNLDYLGITNDIEYVTGDMIDEASLIRLIRLIKPNLVFNLAAQSDVRESFDLPSVTFETNSLGVVHLLESIKTHCPATRLYQASSSEQWGNNSVNGIQDEDTPFQPRSPYAVSKVAAHFIVKNYREAYGLFCCNGICHNHEGPLRGKGFVTRKITDGVARIRTGHADSISLGNMDAYRDWGYSPDYCDGMILMLEHNEPDDYVMCTGESHSVREFVEESFKCIGVTDWQKYIKVDPRFKRPTEVDRLCGSYKKIKEKLGWEPKVKFKELIRIMLEADIDRYEKEVVTA